MKQMKGKFTRFRDIPDDIQQVMLAKNILEFAKMYQKQKHPVYQVIAESHYQTANMIVLQLTKGDKN